MHCTEYLYNYLNENYLIHLADNVVWLILRFLWILKPFIYFGKILSLCVFIEFFTKIINIVWNIYAKNRLFEVNKPSFPEQSSPLANLAYIAGASAYLAVYFLLKTVSKFQTGAVGQTIRLKDIVYALLSWFKKFIFIVVTGISIRVYRILKVWWRERPKHWDFLRPFTQILAEIVEPKVILCADGHFQLNPRAENKTPVKIAKTICEFIIEQKLNIQTSSLSPTAKAVASAHCDRFMFSFNGFVERSDVRDWQETAKNLNMMGLEFKTAFFKESYSKLRELPETDLREAERIYSVGLKALGYQSASHEKFNLFKGMGFGAKYFHYYAVNELKDGLNKQPYIIGVTHVNPINKWGILPDHTNTQLLQTYPSGPLINPVRRDVVNSAISLIAPLNNVFEDSNQPNVKFSTGCKDVNIQGLGSTTEMSDTERNYWIIKGLFHKQTFPYHVLFRKVAEYNAQQNLMAQENPAFSASTNELTFKDETKQAVFDEYSGSVKAELEGLLGREAATQWVAARSNWKTDRVYLGIPHLYEDEGHPHQD